MGRIAVSITHESDYAVAIALFGGTTQLFETLLIRWTGNPIAPAWYMMGAVAVALTGAMLIPESPRRSSPLRSDGEGDQSTQLSGEGAPPSR